MTSPRVPYQTPNLAFCNEKESTKGKRQLTSKKAKSKKQENINPYLGDRGKSTINADRRRRIYNDTAVS